MELQLSIVSQNMGAMSMSYNHVSYNHLSYTPFVLQIICTTDHLYYRSFVLQIICTTDHLYFRSFVLQIISLTSGGNIICPIHFLSSTSVVLKNHLFIRHLSYRAEKIICPKHYKIYTYI